MELNNLKPAKGSTHHDKRIGRGAGSGHGGTATRGHKGAQSRSGYSRKLGKAINLSTLEELAAKKSLAEITVDTLIAAGFISSKDKVKILGNGAVTKALSVKAHAFSKSAEAAITAAGGSVEKL